ncbi:hypothetical protein Q0601_15445 [Paracoccus onubensis]|uniref:hypothetical protein n=1 Tax=Paracoccus onubensis TaxID=1675788 RepID=UPI0027310533|nr:hypothetical protein [Paracoccus onubensis]MDP0928578.1 hypothetical protein [Paracoccus onubensis]
MIQKLQEYQPTKGTLVWTAVGTAVLTMVIGFTAGGWVTGGSAREMTEQASNDSRKQLVASICVDRFVSDANAADNFTKLKEARSYERDNLIEDGGWSTIDALEDQVSGAADLCAKQIAALDALPEVKMDTVADVGSAEAVPASEANMTDAVPGEGENAG